MKLEREAVEAYRETGVKAAAAKKLGIPISTLKSRIERAETMGIAIPEPKRSGKPVQPEFRQTFTANTGEITSLSGEVRTVDDALNKAEVDRDVWEVDRFVANAWQSPDNERGTPTNLWQVKVWLKRRQVAPAESMLQDLLEQIREHAPKYPKIKRARTRSGLMLILSLSDHHFGKLAWADETGDSYDLKIATSRYLEAGDRLLRSASVHPVEKIVLILGNDYYHINNAQNTTAHGTRMDVDSRWQKVFVTGRIAAMQLIDRARVLAPVEVKIVPGNHDPEWAFFLGEALACAYSRDKDVTVDNAPGEFKCIEWGSCLLGLNHSDKVKANRLVLEMAEQWPKAWAGSKFRAWLLGHLHKKGEDQFTAGDTIGSVLAFRMPSLCGMDAWHASMGFRAAKAAEGQLWSKTEGLTDVFVVNSHALNAA